MLPTHAPQNSRFNFRDAGILILNLLVAVMGTAALVFPFTFFPRQQGAVVLKSDLLTADFLNVLAAFGLGYFAYRNWRPTASKWIWLFGLCWFVCGALRALDASNGAALWEISREDAAFDLDSCIRTSITYRASTIGCCSPSPCYGRSFTRLAHSAVPGLADTDPLRSSSYSTAFFAPQPRRMPR